MNGGDGEGIRRSSNRSGDGFILSVDVGTTTIRGHVYNKEAQIVGQAFEKIELVYPQQGWVEVNPDNLWHAFVKVCTEAIADANLNSKDITAMGMSTLRNTFITWDKVSGEYFHNFSTWKDIRSDELCSQWNRSLRISVLRFFGKMLHVLTRRKRFLLASMLRFTTGMVVMRLLWALQTYPVIRERAIEGRALYGTVDTWLVWKLTQGKVHATDPSNACVSGLYDPFELKWADWSTTLFNIPNSLLPEVRDTNGNFGYADEGIFGAAIPIRCVCGDQCAAMFGECCFEVGDVKCTLGTGSFINVNTGNRPHASYKGLYPVVGWKLLGEEATYLAEGSSYDTGTTISWAQKIGLFSDASQTSDIAKSVSTSDGVYFVPAFSGIQAPVNDARAVSAFIGVSPETTKAHMVRALLESIAFRVKQMYEIMIDEASFKMSFMRINGGVSSNDFILQLIADLTGKGVNRADHREMSALGAAFLAGLASGVWEDKKQLSKLRRSGQVFIPGNTWDDHYRTVVANWERAVRRCLSWYNV